jgi:transcriptional regulator with XRE-family HTH domain
LPLKQSPGEVSERPDVQKVQSFIRRVAEKDALDALLSFRNHEIDENILAVRCFPYLKRISSEMASRFRFSGTLNADDIFSEIWLVFRNWVVPNFDPTKKYLTPLVLKCAQRVCLDIVKSHGDVIGEEDEAAIRSSLESNQQAGHEDHVTVIDEDAIDRRMARSRISEILAGKRRVIYDPKSHTHTHKTGKDTMATSMLPGYANTQKAAVALPKEAMRKPARENKNRSPEQTELANIRKKLGWTQYVFASELGIGVPRLASYEYGKTSGVPERIMTVARALLKDEGGAAESMSSKFSRRSMADILAEWAALIGIAPNNNRALGVVCGGISIPTIVRWRNGVTRPSIQNLIRYENNVYTYVQQMKKSAKTALPTGRRKAGEKKPEAAGTSARGKNRKAAGKKAAEPVAPAAPVKKKAATVKAKPAKQKPKVAATMPGAPVVARVATTKPKAAAKPAKKPVKKPAAKKAASKR